MDEKTMLKARSGIFDLLPRNMKTSDRQFPYHARTPHANFPKKEWSDFQKKPHHRFSVEPDRLLLKE